MNTRLEEIMVESFDAVVSYAEKHGVNNRTAAYMLALDRVAFAIKLRGFMHSGADYGLACAAHGRCRRRPHCGNGL